MFAREMSEHITGFEKHLQALQYFAAACIADSYNRNRNRHREHCFFCLETKRRPSLLLARLLLAPPPAPLLRYQLGYENMKKLKRYICGILKFTPFFLLHVHQQTQVIGSGRVQEMGAADAAGWLQARGLCGLVFAMRAGCAGWLHARRLCWMGEGWFH
jgi:hypothetical protein